MEAVTKWQMMQMCKIIMCVSLSNEIMFRNRHVEGLIGNFDECAEWSSQWLRPHWELVIKKRVKTHFFIPDAQFELYPLHEDSGNRGRIYYAGNFHKFVDASSPVLKDAQQLDPSGIVALLAYHAIHEYGKTLATIALNDAACDQKIEANDHYLEQMLERPDLLLTYYKATFR